VTAEDLLASWSDTATRRTISAFVTLWSKKPVPIQLDFTLFRMAALAGQDTLERAKMNGWTVISIKDDWTTVFADA
jgi:hypothetical protein